MTLFTSALWLVFILEATALCHIHHRMDTNGTWQTPLIYSEVRWGSIAVSAILMGIIVLHAALYLLTEFVMDAPILYCQCELSVIVHLQYHSYLLSSGVSATLIANRCKPKQVEVHSPSEL